MARKKKDIKAAGTEPSQEASSSAEVQSEDGQADSVEVSSEAVKEAAPVVSYEPETIGIKDAASRFIKGFKEHQHWPALQKYAQHHGLGDRATIEECKNLFRMFGHKI